MGWPEAILFDIGGTLVDEAPPATAVADLVPNYRPGVVRLLAALAGKTQLGAVTDTTVMIEADVRAALAPAGMADRLDVVVTSVEAGSTKPDPAGLRLALDRLGVADPADVVFVGDQPQDRSAALAAGVPFVAAGDAVPLPVALHRFLAESSGPFEAARWLVGLPDSTAQAAAEALHLRLTKPPGSLGRLESLGAWLAAVAATNPPPIPAPAAVAVFAGDHGVWQQGVSPWPQEVTAQMVANLASGGAAINVLARRAEAAVVVVDVGVATDVPLPSTVPDRVGAELDPVTPVLLRRGVRRGTDDLSERPAMTFDDARAALDVGAATAMELVAAGARLLVTGDMGIANTTPAAALIAAFTARAPSEVTGRGTGVGDEVLATKVRLVEHALARAEAAADPLRVLAEVGGLEHAALAGFVVAAAAAGVPVLVDGVIALSALLVAEAFAPGVTRSVVAGHRSTEPGASVVLAHLGLEPVLDLQLRLGEGTGAMLAVPLLQSAAAILSEMATFDGAGVTKK